MTDQERIEKEAEEAFPKNGQYTRCKVLGYIAGATAQLERTKQQLKEERNKTIDVCIEALDFSYEINSKIKIILESLKQDSK